MSPREILQRGIRHSEREKRYAQNAGIQQVGTTSVGAPLEVLPSAGVPVLIGAAYPAGTGTYQV